MSRYKKDLVGSVFGQWTVIKFDEGFHGNAGLRWVCKCSCGVERPVISAELKMGRTKSCGCADTPDLTGMIFGDRTVQESAGINRYGAKLWKCLCSCGNVDIVRGDGLRLGSGHRCKRCAMAKAGKSRTTHGLTVKVNRVKDSIYKRQRAYGLSASQFNAMVKKQKSLCVICKLPAKGKQLHVDHCHTTGKVRGLLCSSCNLALGMFKDNPRLLRRAASYLEKGKVNGKEESSNSTDGDRSDGQDPGLQMQFLHPLGSSEMQGRLHPSSL